MSDTPENTKKSTILQYCDNVSSNKQKSRFSTKKESKMGITEDMFDMLEQVAPDELDDFFTLRIRA